MIAGLRGGIASLALAMICVGCRWPDAPLASRSRIGTVYDTKHEKLLDSGKALPLLEQAWRDDVHVYAEPVAIRRWRDGVSTWDVFFATNRSTGGNSIDRVGFGTRPLDAPQYGRAEVTIPRRRRGVDPKLTPGESSLWKRKGADAAEDGASVDLVESLDSERFVAGVSDLVRRSRQKDVLVFVHGFNVGFDACLVRAAQLGLDMPFNGAVVAWSWPSLASVARYRDDESQNEASVAPFLEFLTTLRSGLPKEAKIHIVVHSMGNRIVLAAVSTMRFDEANPPIDNLCLFAPDVGLAQYRTQAPEAARRCRRTTLYASRHDAALIASKGMHAEQRAGDAHPPVLVDGVETIDCSAIDGTSFLGHSYYSGNVDVLADLFEVLKRDRPADKRAHLKPKTNDRDRWWRWTGNAPHDIWTWHFDDLAAARENERGR